jgi:threonylcarbamoyladenosine tRNA methylthiotransferase MtaB
MPQVERAVVKERAAQLRNKGATALTRFLEGHAGNDVELLVEKGNIGRTRQFAEMRVPAAVPPGAMVRARVSGHDGVRLAGEVMA